jgi:hypothetical protein
MGRLFVVGTGGQPASLARHNRQQHRHKRQRQSDQPNRPTWACRWAWAARAWRIPTLDYSLKEARARERRLFQGITGLDEGPLKK